MAAGMFGVYQVEIGNVIDDAAVQLFRDIEIKAAVPRLHVKDRDLQPFGHIGGQAGIGIPEDQQGIGADLLQYSLGFPDDISHRRTQRGSVHA